MSREGGCYDHVFTFHPGPLENLLCENRPLVELGPTARIDRLGEGSVQVDPTLQIVLDHHKDTDGLLGLHDLG